MTQRSDEYPGVRAQRERDQNQQYDSRRNDSYGYGDPRGRRETEYRSESQYRSDPRYRDYRYGSDRYRNYGEPWYAERPFHEDSEPRYFGTGSQGQGGPSFTGGTYGSAVC